MSKNNGGPAFPYQVSLQSGMSLRDYFAAKAISAAAELSDCHKDSMPAVIARNAYVIADAMIAERDREQ